MSIHIGTGKASRRLIRAAVLLAGAQVDEVEKVIEAMGPKPIPESPQEIIEDIINALTKVRSQ